MRKQSSGQQRSSRSILEKRGPGSSRVSLRKQGNGDVSSRRGEEASEGLVKALGWFSVGLGLAELAGAPQLATWIGAGKKEHTHTLMRVLGLRELTSGVGILTQSRRPGNWLWSRVAGDAIDLALLGSALRSDEAQPGRLAAALGAVAGVTALDIYASQQWSQQRGSSHHAAQHTHSHIGGHHGHSGEYHVHVRKSITINRPADEVYRFWHNFENLPRFMQHLESVKTTGQGRSHWKATAPAGTTVEWDAETTEDKPNERISWKSLPGADVENSGTVSFKKAPGDQGTELLVELRYTPPGGTLGAWFAKLFGEEPSQQVQKDLRRFKQVMELGEVVKSDASIHEGAHPAQPAEA